MRLKNGEETDNEPGALAFDQIKMFLSGLPGTFSLSTILVRPWIILVRCLQYLSSHFAYVHSHVQYGRAICTLCTMRVFGLQCVYAHHNTCSLSTIRVRCLQKSGTLTLKEAQVSHPGLPPLGSHPSIHIFPGFEGII